MTITINGSGTIGGLSAGDYIAKWNHPTLARPTDEELE